MYIQDEITDKINQTADIIDIIGQFVKLKKKGSAQVGDCPCCQSKEKLSVNGVKDIWKCFKCDEGGKGYLLPVIIILTLRQQAIGNRRQQEMPFQKRLSVTSSFWLRVSLPMP
jgi:ribosomal protein L37AE/L43A